MYKFISLAVVFIFNIFFGQIIGQTPHTISERSKHHYEKYWDDYCETYNENGILVKSELIDRHDDGMIKHTISIFDSISGDLIKKYSSDKECIIQECENDNQGRNIKCIYYENCKHNKSILFERIFKYNDKGLVEIINHAEEPFAWMEKTIVRNPNKIVIHRFDTNGKLTKEQSYKYINERLESLESRDVVNKLIWLDKYNSNGTLIKSVKMNFEREVLINYQLDERGQFESECGNQYEYNSEGDWVRYIENERWNLDNPNDCKISFERKRVIKYY